MVSVVGEGSPELPAAEESFERQLLVRHRDGDPDAFEELVQRFRAPVFSYLVRCGVEPASRDDLFQEIFIKIHNASARYRAEQPLPPVDLHDCGEHGAQSLSQTPSSGPGVSRTPIE